jgi:hypothetical protein
LKQQAALFEAVGDGGHAETAGGWVEAGSKRIRKGI